MLRCTLKFGNRSMRRPRFTSHLTTCTCRMDTTPQNIGTCTLHKSKYLPVARPCNRFVTRAKSFGTRDMITTPHTSATKSGCASQRWAFAAVTPPSCPMQRLACACLRPRPAISLRTLRTGCALFLAAAMDGTMGGLGGEAFLHSVCQRSKENVWISLHERQKGGQDAVL